MRLDCLGLGASLYVSLHITSTFFMFSVCSGPYSELIVHI